MNKKGKFYVLLLCVSMVIFLLAGYVILKGHYNKYGELGVTKNIGFKQNAIVQAVREGERMQLYVQQAANLSMSHSQKKSQCGEAYFGYTLVGSGSYRDWETYLS